MTRLLSAAISSALAALLIPSAWAGFEGTPEYHTRFEQVQRRDSAIDRAQLAPYKILLVPGLLTEWTARVGRVTGELGLTPKDGFLASFFQQMAWMKKAGIPYEMARINQEGSCDENGDFVASIIRSSSRKVIVVTQSKAGVDVLHGLIRNPDVRSKIAGWVAYQPPHAGSVLSDLIEENLALRHTFDLVMSVVKGSSFAYQDEEREFRRGFNAAFKSEIEKIPREFPVVTLVTSEDGATLREYLNGDKSKVAFLSPFVGPIVANGGGLNDGIASFEGTCLDGAVCAYVPGIDHFAAVMNTGPFKTLSRQERITMFRTLLDMLASRIQPTSAPEPVTPMPATLGLQIQEWLAGSFQWTKDPQPRPFAFHIQINVSDLDAYLRDPRHLAPLSGNVDAEGRKRLAIIDGESEFFVDARPTGDPKDTKLFLYRFVYSDPDRGLITFVGRKIAHHDLRPFDLWKDTTTIEFELYLGKLSPGERPMAPSIGKGVLRMKPSKLLESIANLRAPGKNALRSTKAVAEFGRFFFGNLWEIYGFREQ